MRFRQIHLDFHNHGLVAIGGRFSRKQFQDMLKLGNVNSITVFAKCFHGWAYYDTKQFDKHPGLRFDLLGEMIAAAHEIGVRTQKKCIWLPRWKKFVICKRKARSGIRCLFSTATK
ncbi:hypothetical protein FE784_25795 [Paenibacillus hemerocallicola]|uniref:Beta-galactosidase n=1 Tax=Paenibacillus hemerocallicola TaxID=1172614 RepID=A0A5C4T3I8_9BACL|nr:hypothetical protein [Paenibacillus hemerocallicola]TNJ63335.1 hypothetical protein FE784_25795 [Paenibacillus hemerocallicola]